MSLLRIGISLITLSIRTYLWKPFLWPHGYQFSVEFTNAEHITTYAKYTGKYHMNKRLYLNVTLFPRAHDIQK